MNHCVYALLDGGTTVYIGETADLPARIQDHRREGKIFDSQKKLHDNLSDARAKALEKEELSKFRSNNGGKNPKYNKDSDG